MQRLIDACLARPTATILIAALVTLACGSGAFRLGITSDYRVFFSEDNPQLLDFQEQEALFYQSDTLIFGVAGEIFSPRMLAAIDWLTERSKHLPHVTRVHSVTNYPHFTTQGDALSTGPGRASTAACGSRWSRSISACSVRSSSTRAGTG